MSAPALYLVDLTAYDPNSASTSTLRFSTGRGYTTSPAATPANTYYDPRLLQPVEVSRNAFSLGATMGRSQILYGDLVLLNVDGALDYLLRLGLDGRAVNVYRSAAYTPSYLADFQTVLIGTMEQPEASGDLITIKIHDRQFDLDIPLQTTRYTGAGGLEGVAGDLEGKVKPLCFGLVLNVDPPCVNTGLLIYQVHDGAVADVPAAYDQGASLTKGADYADQAAMEATAPAASNYRVWPAGGYFRLGSTPAGLITADVTQGANAAARTAAQIFSVVAQRSPTVESGDITAADLTALDALDASVLGYWTKEEVTIAEACDLVGGTVGAWWGVDRTGKFRIKRLVAPASADSVATLTEHDLVGRLDRLTTNDPGHGLPMYRQVIRWGRYHVTQTTDLAAGVSAARRGELATEWRKIVSTDTNVQTIHLLAPEVVRDSLYTAAANALTEADRRLELYKVRRDRYELVVPLNDETYEIDLGDTIVLSHPRYGLRSLGATTGSPFVVIGIEPDAKNGRLTLNVWGSSTGSENRITQDDDFRITSTGDYRVTQAA